VREAASAALSSIRAKDATPAGFARLAVLSGRFDAALAQGAVAAPAFVEALESRDARRRLQAAESLAKLRAPEAAGALVRVLTDSDRAVAEAACGALVQIGSPAVPDLLRAIEGNDVSRQRLSAEALGRIGDPSSIAGLCGAIDANRDAVTDYPDPHEVARTAHAGVLRILRDSAAECSTADLRALSGVPDAVLRGPGHPGTAVSTVDCTDIRELARGELSARG
jgi:HEAT repeat protein